MLTVTPKAVEKLTEIMKNDNKDPQKDHLRVFVQGGGCSGFQYGLMVDENGAGPHDKEFDSNGIKLIVDPISITYLTGATIDFVENDTGGGFTFINPNAKSTCGCGQSFNTD